MRHRGHSELLYQNPPHIKPIYITGVIRLYIKLRIIIGVDPGVQSVIQPHYQVMAVIWIAAPGFLSNVSYTCTPQSDLVIYICTQVNSTFNGIQKWHRTWAGDKKVASRGVEAVACSLICSSISSHVRTANPQTVGVAVQWEETRRFKNNTHLDSDIKRVQTHHI